MNCLGTTLGRMRRVSTSRLGRQLIHFDGAFEVRVDEYFGMRGALRLQKRAFGKKLSCHHQRLN